MSRSHFLELNPSLLLNSLVSSVLLVSCAADPSWMMQSAPPQGPLKKSRLTQAGVTVSAVAMAAELKLHPDKRLSLCRKLDPN